MATVVGAVTTSHVPAIGRAIEKGLEQGRCIAEFTIGLRTRSAA